MTALVSLLFIAMIPIDYKITNFSLHLFVYFFIIFGELTSATSEERILFSQVPHPLINKKFMCLVFAYARPVSQCYRQRKA